MEAGPELNARVATEVMGWKCMTEGELYGERFSEVYPGARQAGFDESRVCSWWLDPSSTNEWGEPEAVCPIEDEDEDDLKGFKPSTDIGAAWEVVEKLALTFELGWLPTDKGLNWDASFGEKRGSEDGTTTYAETAPLAICLAALKAVE